MWWHTSGIIIPDKIYNNYFVFYHKCFDFLGYWQNKHLAMKDYTYNEKYMNNERYIILWLVLVDTCMKSTNIIVAIMTAILMK